MKVSNMVVLFSLVLVSTAADAQTPDGRGYVAVKGGANIERAEDGLAGESVGGGIVVGTWISEAWAVEGEFWMPRSIQSGSFGDTHRDTLAGVSFRRSFGAGVRPHLLFGVHIARTQDQLTTCGARRPSPSSPGGPILVMVSCDEPDVVERHTDRFSTFSWFPLVGAGVEIPLVKRIVLIPDVRLQVAVGSLLARPAIALGFAF